MKTTVKDVMTTRVIWVRKDATFREMAVALREYRVSAFPVVDDDRKVIGVVSEADMLNKEALIDESGFVDGILHRHVQGVVAVRDRLDYPPVERSGDRYDTLANFPMD